MINVPSTSLGALPVEYRHRLMRIAHEVNIAEGTRLFEEGQKADRFWIVRTGSVTLDVSVPGRHAPTIESLGAGQLVGWSWMFAPYLWHLGGEAMTLVRAYEFDATAVRLMSETDPSFGRAMSRWVGEVIALRLHAARTRLLDLYAPYGSGPMP
jgi:CRP-like cAMP-binding protein